MSALFGRLLHLVCIFTGLFVGALCFVIAADAYSEYHWGIGGVFCGIVAFTPAVWCCHKIGKWLSTGSF